MGVEETPCARRRASDSPDVPLRSSEMLVVLNQGEDYLEGYLKRKPTQKYAQIELALQKCKPPPSPVNSELESTLDSLMRDQLVGVPWKNKIARGKILSTTEKFADAFLIDYGIRECCSRESIFQLPREFAREPGYGIRVNLETCLSNDFTDTEVAVFCLKRQNKISAMGTLTPLPILRPANDVLLNMIGERCMLMQVKVMRVASPREMGCSHMDSLTAVEKALDGVRGLVRSKLSYDKVTVNKLVLVRSDGSWHRAVVCEMSQEPVVKYLAKLIDKPGTIETAELYECPLNVANSAPRSLMRVKLTKPVRSVKEGEIVTLVCYDIDADTVTGALISRSQGDEGHIEVAS